MSYISFTTLSKDIIEDHKKEYGSIALGFSKNKLIKLAKEKSFMLNPCF
jgi:hypothetical protein